MTRGLSRGPSIVDDSGTDPPLRILRSAGVPAMASEQFCAARRTVLVDNETRLPSARNLCGMEGSRAPRSCSAGRAPDELEQVTLLEVGAVSTLWICRFGITPVGGALENSMSI